MTSDIITVTNDGQRIVATNYWDSKHAAAGLLFVSWNARAARILVPEPCHALLPDMRTASEIVISRGPLKGVDTLELLFDDHSEAPFMATIPVTQSDRLIPDTDQGGGLVVTVWTQDGVQMSAPGWYRRVLSLPCLQPWRPM